MFIDLAHVKKCYLFKTVRTVTVSTQSCEPGSIAQSVGHLTRKSEVLGSIPGLATYFRCPSIVQSTKYTCLEPAAHFSIRDRLALSEYTLI